MEMIFPTTKNPPPQPLTTRSRSTPAAKMASLWRPKMSLYRAKKLDIGCFVNTMIIRDHTKRKVFEAYETERYARSLAFTSSFLGSGFGSSRKGRD